MFKTKNHNNKKAFTIVELVIVIAVIAILMGILFIGGNAISDNAKISKAEGDMRSAEIAFKSALGDNSGDRCLEAGMDADDLNSYLEKYLEDDFACTLAADTEEAAAPAGGAEEGEDTPTRFVGTCNRKDPWGVKYQVVVEDESTENDTIYNFILQSAGPNKKMDSEEDNIFVTVTSNNSHITTTVTGA